jgi:AcrR family transcriptional regulator
MKDAPPECPGTPAPWSLAAGPQKTARDRILTAASFLFCNRGFAATGIDTVLARAGTAKATLYKHFDSKDALIHAVLEAEGLAWRRWFFGRLAATGGPAEARLLAVFDVLGEWLGDPGFYGCPFINAVAEFDTDNREVRAIADAHKAHLVTWLKAQALELGVADATDLARRFAVLIDGAIVAAQNAHDPSFAATAKSLARDYLAGLQREAAPVG